MSTYNAQFGGISTGLQIGQNTGNVYVRETSNLESVKQAYNIPEDRLSRYFTGRVDELTQITHLYQTSQSKGPARCIIYGMPGLGKTQLALKFAISAKSRYSFIFWISAASVDKINTGFSHIHTLVTRDNGNLDTVIVKAQKWLEANNDWLLIADNVNHDTMRHLGDLLPQADSKGNVLITTRFIDVAEAIEHARGEQHSTVNLKVLAQSDATDLFLAASKSSQESSQQDTTPEFEAMATLVSTLGYLPLAIDHAAAFAKTSGHTPSEILKFHHGESSAHLYQWEHTLSKHEARSVATLFEPILEKIHRTAPLAYDILQLLAFLDPENLWIDMVESGLNGYEYWKTTRSKSLLWPKHCHKIKLPYMKRIGGTKEIRTLQSVIEAEETKVKECVLRLHPVFRSQPLLMQNLQVLQQSSLLHIKDTKMKIFWMHDLVQAFLRHRILSRVWHDTALCIVATACYTASDLENPRSWSKAEIYLAHINALSEQLEKANIASVRLLLAQGSLDEYLISAGRYHEAKELVERRLATSTRVLGEQHSETLMAMYHLAWVCIEAYKDEEAIPHAEQYLKIVASRLKRDRGDTFGVKNILVEAYINSGRLEHAKKMIREMVRENLRSETSQDVELSRLISNIAGLFYREGNHADAELIKRQACYWTQGLCGYESIHTFRELAYLAYIVHERDCKQAVKFMRQILSLCIKVIGDDHSLTRYAMELIEEWESENLPSPIKNQSEYQDYLKELSSCSKLNPDLISLLADFLQLSKVEIENGLVGIQSECEDSRKAQNPENNVQNNSDDYAYDGLDVAQETFTNEEKDKTSSKEECVPDPSTAHLPERFVADGSDLYH